MFIKQANRGNKEWWRYLVVFLVVLIFKFISEIPLSVLATKSAQAHGDMGNLRNYLNADALGMTDNQYFLLLFAPMLLVFAALVLAIYLIYGYSFTHIFTAYKKFRWRNFFGAAIIWLALITIVELVTYIFHPENYVITFQVKQFFPLLLSALIFVPFQACGEELYFRGNLLQGLGLLSKSRIFAVIATGTIFGLMHLGNPEVAVYGKLNAMIQYIGFGVLLGIIVVMDGGLEMVFGMHTINNIYLVSVVSYSGAVVKTPAIVHTKTMDPNFLTIGFIGAAILYVLILKKVFKWKSLRWLFEPVKDE